MQQITVKYDGECQRCNIPLEAGQTAMYEKNMGLFCPGHEPTDTEEIRDFRLAKNERKAEKYEEWAEKREVKANAQLNSHPNIRHDIAFITQPGHIPFRSRMIKADEKAFESLNIAEGMKNKADSLRHVQVAGDAERKRQAVRDKLDALINKGTRVYDAVFGPGEVVQVCKKSYRIKFDRLDRAIARDKSYIKVI